MTAHDGGPAAIETEHLGKRFDDRWVVEDLTMRVPTGSILGLIGPSGCGKTTTVRLLNGVYRPDAGDVWVGGRRPTDLRTADRQDLGYLPQQPALFPALTLWENLQLHASLNGVRYRRRPRLREVLDLVDLYPDRRTLVREASGGMQRRLALAATLVH
ncbi:MAG TPA: ABC transporter ATP-binding protein, partial [Acidimicrobiales bacterium]|nr:ABC transporter ATP-binding protein [Acidimicrobiales bacterium]